MRKWLRAEWIEALRGACDGGSKEIGECGCTPHPGCFAKEAARVILPFTQ